jgi:hypothetical protein
MKLRNITLAGTILLALVFTIGLAGAAENATGNETVNATATVNATVNATANGTATVNATAELADDEGADEGIFGPGHVLYGLQIAFENIGETFTYNASEKLGKQVAHARKRIAEARAALKRNDTEAANISLEQYREKMDEVNQSISEFKGNDSGLANAEEMIAKHEMVLKSLLDSHPGNKGLERAYSNSQKLIGTFEEKVNRTESTKNETGNETGEVLNRDKKEENSANHGNSGNNSGNSGNSGNNSGNSGNSGNKRTR